MTDVRERIVWNGWRWILLWCINDISTKGFNINFSEKSRVYTQPCEVIQSRTDVSNLARKIIQRLRIQRLSLIPTQHAKRRGARPIIQRIPVGIDPGRYSRALHLMPVPLRIPDPRNRLAGCLPGDRPPRLGDPDWFIARRGVGGAVCVPEGGVGVVD